MFTKKIISLPVSMFLFLQMAFAQENVVAIRAGKLFDGKNNTLKENIIILIKGNKIVDVGDKISIPQNARIIDLSGMTVMPGLIDAHTHIALHPGSYTDQIMKETYEYKAIYAAVDAKITLESGVTTIRDLGNEGAGLADVALRDAINKGIVPGPRILTAIQPVTATGAYEVTGYSPNVTIPQISYPADGISEIRKQVRNLVKLGADVIKIYMESYEKKETSKDSLTGAFNYSKEEFQALVDEAHRAGLKVAAHTYSDSAARLAIDIGVNSIEHGLFELPGTNAQELGMMVKYGMKSIDALKSATSVAAELLGIGNETGSIEKNKSADLIAFAGDPLNDISAVLKISFVMKDGKIYLEKN